MLSGVDDERLFGAEMSAAFAVDDLPHRQRALAAASGPGATKQLREQQRAAQTEVLARARALGGHAPPVKREKRVINSSRAGVRATFSAGTIAANTPIGIASIPRAHRLPLPQEGVVIHHYHTAGATTGVKVKKGDDQFVDDVDTSEGSQWRDCGPCVEITPQSHERNGVFGDWVQVRFQHSSANYQRVQVLHATAQGIDHGVGWEVVPTEFKFPDTIMVRVRRLGYFRVVHPSDCADEVTLTCFRHNLRGGTPGQTTHFSAWLHPHRPESTRDVDDSEHAIMNGEGGGKAMYWSGFEPCHLEDERARFMLAWQGRVRIELDQDSANSGSQDLGVGMHVLVRPRMRNAAGKLLASGERGAKFVSAKIIGKSSQKTLSSEVHHDESTPANKWVVRYNNGVSEPDVPNSAIKVLKRARRESEFCGVGSSVKWAGEPIRFEFAVDIPRDWAKPAYKEQATCITTNNEGEPQYFPTSVSLPMDESAVLKMNAAADLERQQAREAAARGDKVEVEAPKRGELLKRRDGPGMRLFVPAAARATAVDTSTLHRLHQHLATRGVDVAGGKKNLKPSRIFAVDDDGQQQKKTADSEFDDSNPPYCPTCSRKQTCHHYFARKLKEQRRLAVYGGRAAPKARSHDDFEESTVHDG